MFWCKLRLFLIILGSLFTLTVSAKQTDIQLVVLADDAPFAFVENKQSKGLLVELALAVNEALPQYNITLRHVTFSDIEKRQLPKDTMGFLGAYYRINEWADVHPYSYSVYHEQMCIVCSGKDKDESYVFTPKKWPVDYKDYRLGTVRGYSGWETYGVDARKAGDMNVFEYPNPELAIMGVHRGIVDCVLFEETIFNALTADYINAGKLPNDHSLFVSTRLQRDSVHIGYFASAINEDNQDFVKAFDKAFAKLLMEQALVPIYKNYGVRW